VLCGPLYNFATLLKLIIVRFKSLDVWRRNAKISLTKILKNLQVLSRIILYDFKNKFKGI
jgi:hypothetical protein